MSPRPPDARILWTLSFHWSRLPRHSLAVRLDSSLRSLYTLASAERDLALFWSLSLLSARIPAFSWYSSLRRLWFAASLFRSATMASSLSASSSMPSDVIAKPHELEFGHVPLPVLYVLVHQVQAEHLARVAPAHHGGVLAQGAARQHLRREGGVGDFDPVGVREQRIQVLPGLQEGLDVRCDVAYPDPGAQGERAVVYGEPQGAEDLDVAPPLQGLPGLDDRPGGDVAGCDDAVVRLTRIQGGDGVAGVLSGDEDEVPPSHRSRELRRGLLRIGAGDAHVGDSHDHVRVKMAAVYRKWVGPLRTRSRHVLRT